MNIYVTGNTIKQLREMRKLTQAELAGKIGVSSKTVSKWETARGLPDISLLQPLAEALGFRSVRDLQKQIEKERAAGAVILSDPCGGGYYLSDDPAELLRFTRTLEARARNTIKAAESARRALDAATGQESMEGWYDE